jgi:hypothetical protein
MDHVMFRRRMQNASVALVGLTLPFLIACGAAELIVTMRRTTQSIPTPNPKPAPPWILGPLGLLVYADPWYAGTGSHLLTFGASCLVAIVIGVFLGWPIGSGQRSNRTMLLVLLALLAGSAFAGPWVHAVICLMGR